MVIDYTRNKRSKLMETIMGQDINTGNLSDLQLAGGQGADLTTEEALLNRTEDKNDQSPDGTQVRERSNVIFPSSSRDEQALAEGITNIGRISIELPALEVQKSGFSLSKEAAAALVGQFPQYKFLESKGDRDRQTISL